MWKDFKDPALQEQPRARPLMAWVRINGQDTMFFSHWSEVNGAWGVPPDEGEMMGWAPLPAGYRYEQLRLDTRIAYATCLSSAVVERVLQKLRHASDQDKVSVDGLLSTLYPKPEVPPGTDTGGLAEGAETALHRKDRG